MKTNNENRKKIAILQPYSVRDNLIEKIQRNHADKQENSIEMNQMGSVRRASTVKSDYDYHQQKKRTTSRIEQVRSKLSVMPSQFQVRSNKMRAGQNQAQTARDYKQNSYDIWDLTYTLMCIKIPILFGSVCFLIFLAIRYYTMACLVYIATNSHDQHILWVLIVIADRLLYMILVIKISLQIPQTRTEIVLKSHWNSTQNKLSDLFSVVDKKKLFISILRGIIPAEFAFIYIRAQPRRRFQLYVAINYINSSIQAVLYYPFFIIYCFLLPTDNTFSLNKIYQGFTISLAVFAEVIMIILSIGLLLVGIKKKYGKIIYCLK